MISAPITQNAHERLAKLRQAADMLSKAQAVLQSIGDPPRVQFRDVLLNENASTIGAVQQWIAHEQEKLS